MVEQKKVAILKDIEQDKQYPVNNQKPEAIVIHCVDPRFQDAFRAFVKDNFGFQNYIPVVIGGGIHAFGAESFKADYFEIIKEKVKLFVGLMDIKHLVLINHDDCKWYQQFTEHYHDGDHVTKSKNDMVTAEDILKSELDGITISSYWAKLEECYIQFKKVGHA